MTKYRQGTTNIFIALEEYSRKIRELYNYPDLPDDEKKRITASIRILKIYIEDLLAWIGEKS